MRTLARAALWLAPTLILGLCLWAGPALAEQEAPPGNQADSAAPEQKPAQKLGDLTVRDKPLMEGLQATSATVLDRKEIMDRIYTAPADILKLSPGVSISEYHQAGIPTAVQMRGFTTVSHGNDAAMFLDGVPLNDLERGDTNMIIPDEMERVEIVKGPASTFAGKYASAGSIWYYPIMSGDFTHLRMQYGSFNTQDMVGVMARRDGNLDHVYAGELYHTNGYQSNSTWDKQVGAGRWTYHLSDRLDADLGVRAYNSTWDAPGYITQRVYDSNPSQAVSNVNGGNRRWDMVQGNVRYRLGGGSDIRVNAWTNQADSTRFYQNWVSSTQKLGSNYGYESLIQRDAEGAGLSYNYLGKVLERQTRLVLGLSAQREQQSYEYWNLTVGNGRSRGSKYQDDDLDLYTTSLYGELNYQIFKPLRLVLGSRYDKLNGTLDRHLSSLSYDREGPEIFSPKLGLILTVHEGYDLFANYSKGFALPGVTDFMTRSYLDPAIRTQYETGLKTKPVSWNDSSLTFWRLDTTDDFQASLSDPTIMENAGETRRQGVEAETNFYPWKHLRLHLDYGYMQTEYLDYNDGGVQRSGNELPNVPHHIVNAEVGWQPPEGLGGRLNYRYQSEWFVDAANSQKADAFDSVNAQVSYRFDRRYKLALDVINVFDQKYAEYVGYSNGTKTYAPADPLSAYLTFTIDW